MSFISSILSFFVQLWFKIIKICYSKTREEKILDCTNEINSIGKYSKNIPHAKGLLPFVGPLFSLIAAGGAPNLHLYIDKRHRELGPIFYENLGGGLKPIVFVSSAKLMRAVFNFEGKYPRHPLPDAWKIYNKKHNCARGLFFMDGEEWHLHRRLLNRGLLNGNLSWMQPYIHNCTQQLVERWSDLAKASSSAVSLPNLENQMYASEHNAADHYE